MTEEQLPEVETEVGSGYGHAQPHPKDHQSEADDVACNDECANEFHGIHNIQ